MKLARLSVITITLVASFAVTAPHAAEVPELPEIDGEPAVATVNGEPITLSDLFQQVSAAHEGMQDPESAMKRPDPSALLERLIGARLLLQEARSIGLDQLPTIERKMGVARLDLIRRHLAEESVKEIATGNPADVERFYRDAVRHWKVQSVLFSDGDAAAEFHERVSSGGDYDAIAAKLIESGDASGSLEPRALKAREMIPEVAALLEQLEQGGVTPPVELPQGFTVVRLLGTSYPDDADARAQAQQDALNLRRQVTLSSYTSGLRDRYVVVDEKVVESIDLGPDGPGIEAYRDDTRTVAKIKGGEPVAVKDLVAGMEKKFFHGVENAVARGRISTELLGILDRVALERAARLEAKRLGIEDRREFKSTIQAQEDALVFVEFVQRAIDPEITLSEEEVREYYNANLGEFTTPEMMRLDSLVFDERTAAEATLERLRGGADIRWIRENSEGLVPDDVPLALPRPRNQLVTVTSLPLAVQSALAGAAAGDYRFYGPEDGPHYVLLVEEVFAPRPSEYAAVREEIASRIFAGKRQASIEAWTERLREASEIKRFVNDSELETLLGLSSGEGT